MSRTQLDHVWRPAVNFGERRNGLTPDLLLLHYTAMDNAEKACEWLCCEESGVSCHYLIDERGTVIQMVDEGMRAWHAGVSHWDGITDINSISIGIEIQNDGEEAFTNAQMKSVIALCRDIIQRYGIEPRRVLAHSDVAPGRKSDPGAHFDWRLLYENGIGHWIDPVPITPGGFFQLGDSGEAIEALQALLARYGYGIGISGVFDQKTRDVITAFQLHFRQERCDGIADPSTIETLYRLSAS